MNVEPHFLVEFKKKSKLKSIRILGMLLGIVGKPLMSRILGMLLSMVGKLLMSRNFGHALGYCWKAFDE
jgi:hypothetical protein